MNDIKCAVLIVIGVNLYGNKDVLGLWKAPGKTREDDASFFVILKNGAQRCSSGCSRQMPVTYGIDQ